MAIINTSIPAQNFEIIRDAIVEVLGIEFTNQLNLNANYPPVTKIWCERFVPINSETECPTINVNLASTDYDNQTIKKMDGTCLFNIDIYTCAPTSAETGPGDQYAMAKMNKIAGMVRAILSYPDYRNLGLTPGVIISTRVKRFFVGDKNIAPDALSDVVGRMQFEVKCIETAQLESGIPWQQNNTRIKLQESEEGFYYQYPA